MNMDTVTIWNVYNLELYFFILKKVKNKDTANEILQNAFLKIHQNRNQLKTPEKVKAWSFQIVRNEIANYFNNQSKTFQNVNFDTLKNTEDFKEFCCLERFITNLPMEYNEVIELVYIKGKKQAEAAEMIGVSLSNVKARIRRGKIMLKINFKECCKFELNEKGKLIGEPNCSFCEEGHTNSE